MKKLYFVIVLCLLGLGLMSQPVGREKVIVEIGTGTWCTYCPGAAMGADDLVANGCEVGVIENHNGDAFAYDGSNYRNSYYGISGYPTAFFDGTLSYGGGSHTVSMYSNYLPLYQQRIAIPSDFTVDIYGDNIGSTYYIQLVVNKVNGTWEELTLHLCLTESEIVYSWQDQTHLNYVNRLMAPDHFGTIVDFTSEDMMIVELQFTMDSEWVDANCELVAFLQDESDKEIQQGNMVAIPDLEPMPATAGFACDNAVPCIATSVEFEDESLGDIISWNWAFEGGNPATATVENPVVTYNTQGSFDVELIVYDGSVYDTLLNPEYILVITPPVQPDIPTGPTGICQDDTEIQYSIPEVQWATTYVWDVDPASAGTISGPDPVATFTLTPGYLGDYSIIVRADNNCGDGTWSPGLSCTAYLTPAQYTLSDGAGYCEGDDGIPVTLDGSENGVNYELYLDNEATGQVLAGTGSPLDFGNQTEQGIYTCHAYTDNCDANMVGNAYIYVMAAPAKPTTPEGSTEECNYNEGVIYTTEQVTGATSYTWSLSPTDAGTISGTTIEAMVDWDETYTGEATINVAAVNACATGPVSNDLTVSVNAAPQPFVSGEQEVCNDAQGLLYSTPSVEGNTYNWEISGGMITSGAETNEIMVNWGAPGDGYVLVTETTAEGCTMTTNNYEIVIDDCTGIGEGDNGSFSIYPNPVKNELMVRFAGTNSDNRLIIVNQLGQVVCDMMSGDNQQVNINTSEYAQGVYVLRLFGENGVTEKKFVKVD